MTTRATDTAFALVLLVVLAPALLVIWTLARLDGGPAFSAIMRAGRGGHAVRCLVFRTTAWDMARGRASDRLTTRLGRFLRATNLDELPLLFTVLRGGMSLFDMRDDVPKRPSLPRDAA
jgi:lipopolysaccharide/colanic/teichoic acid biosynthesis glycosyltransferase